MTEVLVRHGGRKPDAMRCPRCGDGELTRAVSRFSFKSGRRPLYSESFRERAAPFLKSRPGAGEFFAEGRESDEAKIHALTERIGERIDTAIETHVFKNLDP
jgi:hypothetical protein